MFAGPCFGDLTPAEFSLAIVLDAPSPSPLLLADSSANSNNVSIVSYVSAESAPSYEQATRITDSFAVSQEILSPRASPSRDSALGSLVASGNQSLQNSQSITAVTASPPLVEIVVPDGNDSITESDFSQNSATLISLDEPSSECEALARFDIHADFLQLHWAPREEQPLSESVNPNHPSSANLNIPTLDLPTRADDSPLTENNPNIATPDFTAIDSRISSATDNPLLTETSEISTSNLPIDAILQNNEDMSDTPVVPSSSPIDESMSSPRPSPTLPENSSSQSRSDASDPLFSSDLLPDISLSFMMPVSTSDFSSSPPSSSPEHIFSSPPATSDSSVHLEDLDMWAQKSELNTYESVDTTKLCLPSSSPLHNSNPLQSLQIESDPLTIVKINLNLDSAFGD
ncbi:hypothetical protein B0H10DRAFT_32770 [Mycena sp. CBHHK59/15]|nr:hypothetical protein B0H10DRAFT_32770 [Mycena sp. CBHHK59/15]